MKEEWKFDIEDKHAHTSRPFPQLMRSFPFFLSFFLFFIFPFYSSVSVLSTPQCSASQGHAVFV